MANFNLNQVILGGRLTADPELKQTPNGVSVTSFRIAVNRHSIGGQQPVADFFTVQAWKQTAEFVCRYFKKGSSICVIGAIQNKSWEKNGQKMYGDEIVAEQVTFVDGRDESSSADQLAIGNANAPTAQNFGDRAQPKFEEIKQDDDLPF